MAVDQKHPRYTLRFEDWTKMRDTHAGERAVKEQGTTYLPATGGQQADGMSEGQPGKADYDAYRARATVPDFVKQAVEAMVGVMHKDPARIEVPDRMRPMLDRMTADGESAWTLLRKINEAQLLYGRFGLLLDVNPGAGPDVLPHVACYDAFSIINWDDGVSSQGEQRLELVVLDESEFERRSDFTWVFERKFRVLIMSDQAQNVFDGSEEGQVAPASGEYQTQSLRDAENHFNPDANITPAIAGRTLDQIPFVFVNSNDLVPNPDEPPLLGLADLVLAIYRLEADYRQTLHLQGQETLVVQGSDLPEDARVGAGAKIELPAGADAKFIGISADGLDAMRTALQDDRGRAGDQTTRLLDGDTNVQSGRALNVRLSAKTATLHQIAMTGAEALARILRIAAEWMGLDPSQVVVEPNDDFEDDIIDGQKVLQLMQAVQMGLPLSKRSIHRWLQMRDLTEMDFEQEMEEVEQDRADEQEMGVGISAEIPGDAPPGGGDPPGDPARDS